MAQCKEDQSARAINPREKRVSVTYRKDLENEVLVRYLSYLWVQTERKDFNSHRHLDLAGRVMKNGLPKLTNHNARTNKVI